VPGLAPSDKSRFSLFSRLSPIPGIDLTGNYCKAEHKIFCLSVRVRYRISVVLMRKMELQAFLMLFFFSQLVAAIKA
jgi:hypothetical protein